MISAVAQRYLKMMEAAPAPPQVTMEGITDESHRDSDEKSQFFMENSRVDTQSCFPSDDTARNTFADADDFDEVNSRSEQKFTVFQTLRASSKAQDHHSLKRSNPVKTDATYTIANDTFVMGLSRDTEAMFGYSAVQERADLFPDTEESESESDEESLNNNATSGSPLQENFSFAKTGRDTSTHVSGDHSTVFSRNPNFEMPFIRPLAKRRRLEPINTDPWNDSKTPTEALFGTLNVETLGNQTNITKIDCITIDDSVLKVDPGFCETAAEIKDISMTEADNAEECNFEVPIRVRDKFYEKCFMQKKKVHFNTFFESPKVVKPENPVLTECGSPEKPVLTGCDSPETDEDYDAMVMEMISLFNSNDDEVVAIGNPNQSFTFGSDDDEDDITELDQEDEEFLKDQRLSSSTPTKNYADCSLLSDTKSIKKTLTQGVDAEMSPRSSILSSFRQDSEKQPLEKRLSLSVRKSPPKNTILQPSLPSQLATGSSKKPLGQEEHLDRAVRQLSFEQSPHASLAHDDQVIADNFARDDFEKFLVHYAMEEATPVQPSLNNFKGFTSEQIKSLKNFNQEIVKEFLNGRIKNDTQTNEKNVEVLQKIEKVFISLFEAMSEHRPMELKVPSVRKWSDCIMSQDVLTQGESTPMKTISTGHKSSQRTFTVMVTVLSEVYKLLTKNTTCTKRELYYRDVDLFENQGSVNTAIDSICSMLDVQEFELGVLTSSKGLVAGDLIIKVGDDVTDCTNQCSVPQNPSAISSFESNADYVLVVEKDTVFQRLVSEKIFSRIDEKIILVTAKGYPDVNTRIFLKKIADDLKLPIYILVDADPHGIEIMLTYKYGSMMKIHNSQYLAVPSIQWIG